LVHYVGVGRLHAWIDFYSIRLPISPDFLIKSTKFKIATILDFIGIYRLVGNRMTSTVSCLALPSCPPDKVSGFSPRAC
jgi:hypothetical protein